MATSMLKLATKSVVDQLAAIPYNWKSNNSNTPFPTVKAKPNVLFQQALVFNNQILRQLEGEAIPSDYPQAYVQPILGKPTKLGQVWLYENAIFRLHLADWFLDDQIGGLDQNYEVFAWRDVVRANLEVFFPQYCGALTEVNEEEDFNHDGVYHMIIDFKCAFTDLKGGIFDPDQTRVIDVDPVPVQETVVLNEQSLPPVTTIYGWKDCAILARVVAVPDGSTQILDNGDIIPLQYALNDDGTLTIPELVSAVGIAVLTPFINEGQNIPTVVYDGEGTFDNSAGGGFPIWSGIAGDEISFNASLPIHVPA